MPFSATPSAGFDLNETLNGDEGKQVAVGTPCLGSDGHLYVCVTSTANIAANAVVILTEPAFTVATGAGAFTAPAIATTTGQKFWVKKTAI
jgi:hypothetical protein